MLYKCINCGREIDINFQAAKKIQCSYCGYRILKKVRPQVVKKIPAV